MVTVTLPVAATALMAEATPGVLDNVTIAALITSIDPANKLMRRRIT